MYASFFAPIGGTFSTLLMSIILNILMISSNKYKLRLTVILQTFQPSELHVYTDI